MTTSAPSSSVTVNDLGEHTNKTLRRFISPLGNDLYVLYTFTKPSDETYSVVRVDVNANDALLWVEGLAELHGTGFRYPYQSNSIDDARLRKALAEREAAADAARPVAVHMRFALTASALEELREQVAKLPGEGARKLLAALDSNSRRS